MRRARTRDAAVVCALALAFGGCRGDTRAADADDAITDADTPAELRRMVAELMPRLERLSGLDRLETLRVRRQDAVAVRAYVEQRLEQEMPAERLEGVRLTYAALGLLPDTLDLRALLLDLYTEQVLGYYDPRTTTLFVTEGHDAREVRPVLAHELVHALQDQHTNLDSLIAFERGNDRQTAAHAALEGHAMIVMFAVLAEEAARRALDPADLPNPADELRPALAAQNEQFPVFRDAPAVIRETLMFPYVSGSDFVHRLWASRRGRARYPAPIDSLLPASTAQVLHPVERFIRAREEPVELRFPDPPHGWIVRRDNTFGQLETGIFLARHLGDSARRAAEGWAGDRHRLLIDAEGTNVLQWVSVWRSEPAANGFATAVRAAAARRPQRSVTVDRRSIGGFPAVVITDAPTGARLPSIPDVSTIR